MKLPGGLDLISAINAAWNWPAAMDHLAKNVSQEELDEAVRAREAKHPNRKVWNGPLRHFPHAIKEGKYPYTEPEMKGNPKIREGLIMGLEERFPLEFGFREADSFGGYLILAKDQIIATGDYQDPVRTLEDMSLKDLALAFEEGETIGGVAGDALESCGCDEHLIPYLKFFAKELGVESLLAGRNKTVSQSKKREEADVMGL